MHLYTHLIDFIFFLSIFPSLIHAATTTSIVAPSTPTVTSPDFGRIHGRLGRFNPTIHEYLGIPFAHAPTGTRRFAPPTPLPSQSASINATAFGLSCPSIPASFNSGFPANKPLEGEDCLNLNIWTKPGRGNAPVLVWIYGGAFRIGTTNTIIYDGTQFTVNNDVVLVTINYRINVFGFPNSPAVGRENLGLLDQRAGLEWVRKNIRYFGGDPEKIVIFGESAGAASVDIHSYAWAKDPIVKGLIEQSGTVAIPMQMASENYYSWGNLTEKVGCGSSTEEQKLACMRGKPWEDLIKGQVDLESCTNPGLANFGPRVDGQVLFTPEEYERRGKLGLFARLPLLIGINDKEIGVNMSLVNPGCISPPPEGMSPERFAEVASAVTFNCPAKDAALYRVLHNTPVWRYRYYGSFEFNVTTPGLTPTPFGPAAHAAEIPIVFGSALYFGNPPARERQVIKYIQAAWTAFAKNPTAGLSSEPFNLPRYNPLGKTLIRLTYGNEVTPSVTYPVEFDYICGLLEGFDLGTVAR